VSLHNDDGLDPPRHPNPSRISGWTPEQIAARRHFVEVIAFAVLAVAVILFLGLGIYLTLSGRFVGWLLISLAAALSLVALCVGERLEGDQ
jgi:uncharacterized membrane protein